MEEELSEDRIAQILKDAESRLRQKAQDTAKADAREVSFPRLYAGGIENATYVQHNKQGVAKADDARLVSDDRKIANEGLRKVDDPVTVKKRKDEKIENAGPDWFNLPKTNFSDPSVKRDMQVLGMRNVLDQHRHYRKDKKLGQSQYSVIGEIIEGPTEYFSSRIQKRDRKRTFVEEVLAGEAQTGRFKRKYNEIQTARTSGKKGFYKALKAKRAKKFK